MNPRVTVLCTFLAISFFSFQNIWVKIFNLQRIISVYQNYAIKTSIYFAVDLSLPSVKKQNKRPGLQVNVYCRDISFFVESIIKQLLDSVFVISRIIKVSVRVISLSLRLRLITLTSTLIILDISKTSSNNCLESYYTRSNY